MTIGIGESVGVGAGTIGGVYLLIRMIVNGQNKKIDEQNKKLDGQEKKLEKEYLKESTHSMMCENAGLKLRQHVTDELIQQKEEIFGYLGNIEKLIRENGKR